MGKQSLILAGGGLKVGYQAGVLQVCVDEAGLTFDHADGASGGCFNLAMYCQGMSGRKMADNWRNLDRSCRSTSTSPVCGRSRRRSSRTTTFARESSRFGGSTGIVFGNPRRWPRSTSSIFQRSSSKSCRLRR